MHIFINGNEANVDRPVGSNVFALEILNSIYRLDKKNNYTVLLKEEPKKLMPPVSENWKYKVIGPAKLWTQWALPRYLALLALTPGDSLSPSSRLRRISRSTPGFSAKELKIKNILFSPGHYGAAWGNIPQVVCVMDLAFEKFPNEFKARDLWQLKIWTRRSVSLAKKVIAISESTKKDLVELYGLPRNKVEVVYPGKPGNFQFSMINFQSIFNDQFIKRIKNKKFILFIGTLQPRKNIGNLIRAFAILVKKYPDYKLVIAGKKGWLYDEMFSLVRELNLGDKVIFTGFVSSEEKDILLKKAEFLLFPSFYEGFGFPVLEAFAADCPVLAARNSSLPEVGGKAAVYFENIENPEEMAKDMEKMLKLSESKRRGLIAEGKKQVEKFNWNSAGKKIIRIIENCNQ